MMLQRRPSGVLLALTVSVPLSAALSLAGCTTSAGPGGTSSSTTPSAAPSPANTLPDTGHATGLSVGTLTDLRVGAHDGFDRVVLEFNGPDTPDWNVRYVAQAVGDASGLPIHVTGDAVLEITWSSLFEGYLQAFVGVKGGQHLFRAYALSDPARIVVEVRTD